MTWSVTWTVLPNGFDPDHPDRLALSLVAAPRLERGATTLAGSPLENWPARLAELAPSRLVSDDGAVDLPIAIRLPGPDELLWKRLFPPSTIVAPPGPAAEAMPGVIAGPSTTDAARELESLYRSVAEASPGAWPDIDHPALAPLAAMAAAPEVTFASREERLATAARLDRRGERARAATLAIADVAGHVRQRSMVAAAELARAERLGSGGNGPGGSGAGGNGSGGNGSDPGRSGRNRAIGPPGQVPPIRSIEAPDFHQVVGLLLDHPALARRVGLRLDVTVPLFAGERSIRVVDAQGRPLNGPIVRRQPFSRVRVDRTNRRFTMVPQPDGPSEIVDGMLDVSGVNGDAAVASTIDPVGLSLQLAGIAASRLAPEARARAAAGGRAQEPVALPVVRDVGFTVGRPDRGVTVANHALTRGTQLAPDKPGPDPVLFADDVTTGFRVDVANPGGRFRSLMHRRSTYTVAGAVVAEEDDEGRVEALPLLAEVSPRTGGAALVAGEELFGWDGFGLGASRPGRAVLGDEPGAPTTVAIENVLAPGYDLLLDTRPIPGTIPRLRYGREYDFRARAVDLAGNAIDPAVAGTTHVLHAGAYLRKEALTSPTLVPRRRFSFGESHVHLVVRTNGEGVVVGGPCERHIAPPKSSVAKAELHGMFDAAMGKDVPAAVRSRLLTIARRESGTFNDPTVLGPDGSQIPAPGFAVVTNDPQAEPRVALPLPAGEPLPNGAYAIHDTDEVRLPYLGDVAAGGFALHGVPGHDGPVAVPFPGRWPDVTPVRLVVVPAPAGADPSVVGVKVSADGQVVELSVPAAMEAEIEISSTVHPDLLPHLDRLGLSNKELVTGTAPLICRRQTMKLVHAVERPVSAPVATGGVTLSPPTADATGIDVQATLAVHRPSTSEVHLIGQWVDIVDTGTGPVEAVEQRTSLGSKTVVRSNNDPLVVTARQGLDDTKRRTIAFSPVATTRFREYLDVVAEGDPSRQRKGSPTLVTIPNRSRPTAPVVHSVVPTFTWTRSQSGGVYTSTRETTGVRINLERPWHTTGEGERLGVVVHRSSIEAGSPGGALLDGLVTHWGTDPLEELNPDDTTHLLKNRFENHAEFVVDVTLPGAPAGAAKVNVVGYEVQFDAERDLWFADVDVRLPDPLWPFLRLAVVRYQPVSLDTCHLSPVTRTDFVQLPPVRDLTAQKHGDHGVRVILSGDGMRNAHVEVRQERRFPDPLDTSLDLGSSIGVGVGDGWRVVDKTNFGELADLVLEPAPPFTPSLNLVKELAAGRVVVEEVQDGIALRRITPPATRVVYTETFDRSAVGITGGP